MNLPATQVFDQLYYHDNLTKKVIDDSGVEQVVKKYRQIVLYGGSRSSKSWSLMQLMFIKLCSIPGLKITVWRKTKKNCRDTIMKDWKKILLLDPHKNNLFRENKQEGSFTHKITGAVIIFEGADDEGKVHGMTQDISIFNEITEFSEAVYLQITQRTAETIYVDYNPSKRFWHERFKKKEGTIYLHSWFEMNAFCPPDIVQQLKEYEPWDRDSYDIEDGVAYYANPKTGIRKPISESNQPPPHKKNVAESTADEFMWLVYGLGLEAEKPNKIYKGWKQISDEYYHNLPYTKYYGLDFGSSAPTAFVEVKFDGEKTFYLHQRLYKPTTQMDDSLTDKLSQILGDSKKSALIVADSAKQSIINDLAADGFFITGANKGPGSVELGIGIVQKLNIYVTASSEDIDGEQSVYSWMLDRYDKPTDKPIEKDDHLMDAIRYIIHYLYYYLGINARMDKKK